MNQHLIHNFWSQSVFLQGSVYVIEKRSFADLADVFYKRECIIESNTKIPEPNCRVGVCERRVLVSDGEVENQWQWVRF